MADLASTDVIKALRRPETVFTENYLNDPIRFAPDPRFHPESVIRQLNEYNVIERDNAEFAVVDLNADGAQFYPLPMITPIYKKAVVRKVVNTKIEP